IVEDEGLSMQCKAFCQNARQYTEIRELTPEILRLFNSSIKYSRTAEQSIRIIYRE
ncbi:MAG TPA: hypothetical protein DC053_10220, partial [Lachnoclostridium sp.]|nr:hypothetical protein [Lachnoclostridium sp.]